MRCTNATVAALGIPAESPLMYGTSVLSHIVKSGLCWDDALPAPCTLGRFIKDHPHGSYYICTNGHAMALVDGKLTDTERGGMRRRVWFAAEVTA